MKNKDIIIVQDNLMIAEIVKATIKTRYGFSSSILNSSKNLKVSDLDNAELVILDYHPGVAGGEDRNGVNLVKAIRSINKELPIIIFSGQGDISKAVEFLHEGATDYVDKNRPDYLQHLVRSIDKLEQGAENHSKEDSTQTLKQVPKLMMTLL